MISRRLFGAFFLALALLFGQQAAAMHELSHVGEQLGPKAPGSPAKHSCDQCFLGAQLFGAVGTHVSAPLTVLTGAIHALAWRVAPELPAARLSFRSRAPPTLL